MPIRLTILFTLPLILLLNSLFVTAAAPNKEPYNFHLSEAELHKIALRIYQNECNSDPDKLLWWNQGEAFPSLGIGHFIWYPEGVDQPFKESFPGLVNYMLSEAVEVPTLLRSQHAPWPNRTAYLALAQSEDISKLKQFLQTSMDTQAAHIFQRAQASWLSIIEQAEEHEKVALQDNIQRLLGEDNGAYALIDYVNFKGEGLKISERYNGQGWGLYQVLQQMQDGEPALLQFQDAAKLVLARRANNADKAIERERWLPGWNKRIDSYSR